MVLVTVNPAVSPGQSITLAEPVTTKSWDSEQVLVSYQIASRCRFTAIPFI